MYKIILPLLGFEDKTSLEIKMIDENFSLLSLDKEDDITITIVNIHHFENISFDFQISDDVLNKLNIKNQDDFEIYFTLVKQTPIEKSIVNVAAPILVNQKDKTISQYVLEGNIKESFIALDGSSI